MFTNRIWIGVSIVVATTITIRIMTEILTITMINIFLKMIVTMTTQKM